MNVPPLLLLAKEVVSVRRLLVNRITITLVVVLVVAVALQGYVAANNDGHVTGQVVDADGDPVADATVTLTPDTIGGVPDRSTTTTDDDGRFAFSDPSLIEFTVEAEHESLGESETDRHHLYFRGQNVEVTLVIDG